MRIKSVRIENFRSFKDATVPFNKYTCLVGPNGAGKSTVLTALNVFFRETENVSTDLNQLTREDFHSKNTSYPIKITVTFCDLNEEAQKDFADYVRQGQLVVTAEANFDESNDKAQVKQYGQRLAMRTLAPFFDALNKPKKKVAELKKIYNELRKTHTDLPLSGTKEAIERHLREFEATRPDECELIPSEDQFYGFSKGANRLSKHIQWVYVPAVKDAVSEQVETRNSALGKLLARTVRSKIKFDVDVENLRTRMQQQYQEILDCNQGILKDISSALEERISEWAHPGVNLRIHWKQDSDKSVRVEEPLAHIMASEGEFEGELAQFGHGLQRSYLFVLLQELALTNSDSEPTLILACEEPELYQHPPQTRHLATILSKFSEGDNAQVIMSTHDPRFVSGQGFEDIRMIRKCSDYRSTVSHVSLKEIARELSTESNQIPKPEGILAKIHQALQPSLNEMFFTHRLVLVEGNEDLAHIMSYLHLLGKIDKFQDLGCHIVSVNGKSRLCEPLAIAKRLKIPTYVMFDADADKPDRNGTRVRHERDNKAILVLLGKSEEDPMPDKICSTHGLTMWHSNIGDVVAEDIGEDYWAKIREKGRKYHGHVKDIDKNSLYIGTCLNLAWEDKKYSPNLKQACLNILDPQNYIFSDDDN